MRFLHILSTDSILSVFSLYSSLLVIHMVSMDRTRLLSVTSLIFFIFEQLLCGLWPAQPGHVLSLLLQTQQEAEGNDASLSCLLKQSLYASMQVLL